MKCLTSVVFSVTILLYGFNQIPAEGADKHPTMKIASGTLTGHKPMIPYPQPVLRQIPENPVPIPRNAPNPTYPEPVLRQIPENPVPVPRHVLLPVDEDILTGERNL
jgi:hypothetical protein